MDIITITKILSLFASTLFTTVNVSRLYAKQNISQVNFFIQAIAITIFVYLQFLR